MPKKKGERAGTGIEGLDILLDGLRMGDNVVWQIDSIDEYIRLAEAFAVKASREKEKIIYFRFASHPPLLKNSLPGLKTYRFDPGEGFEPFATKVCNVIEKEGKDVFYLFDSLSELLSAWATDLMIGNFFRVTCPRLYQLNTIAYFAIMRNSHSHNTLARIRKTTQLLIDVYRQDNSFYVHPLKVENRYSHTIFLPHREEDKEFKPVTHSMKNAQLLGRLGRQGSGQVKRKLDYWDRLFIEAQELSSGSPSEKEAREMTERLCKIMITENKGILSLAAGYFNLNDLLDIKYRLIGTGFIGGKSAGMLLARKIVSGEKSLNWEEISEPHDSFFIGSDIFNSYLVENNLWRLHMKQKETSHYFKLAEKLKKELLVGVFPDEVKENFQQVVEYYGASPVIIRSSSLLEDAYGNAFAGKYESVFCANRGTPSERYREFEKGVRRVYASTMSRDALSYRKVKNLHRRREQMALLIQRVSGSHHKKYFFPTAAGVGFSHNTYVWNQSLSPEAGMLRLVFGLGTRAVNRVEGDYPRMVALDNPEVLPYETREIRKFSQHKADIISMEKNSLETINFNELAGEVKELDLNSLASRDYRAEEALGRDRYWILTLENIVKNKEILSSFSKILKSLEKAYEYPVEIEFTLNFFKKGQAKINLLQCRPLQTRSRGKRVEINSALKNMNIFFKVRGNFIGGNLSLPLKKIVHINPSRYIKLNRSDKYQAARLTGKINSLIDKKETPAMLIGPGRWGTTTPSLGVCVNFFEINNFTFLIETSLPEKGFMPEFSFGTHFFQDIVEADIFYAGITPGPQNTGPDLKLLRRLKNEFPEILPDFRRFKDVIGVYDVSGLKMKILSDIRSGKLICAYKKTEPSA